ncbi:DUF72 domain-containing protein [Gillisia limnaea]|uniref:DUF72 domain-containing protein n=1 Tax=Gillisia limnaea TaxID=195907 RepID=UPI00058D99D8|nr:DUF72 domain-containing protein [Gillisia limnaea]
MIAVPIHSVFSSDLKPSIFWTRPRNLVQLPSNWKRNYSRLDKFLLETSKELRWVLKNSDTDWFSPESYELRRQNDVSPVMLDMIKDHPVELTADWFYSSFQGQNYSGSYTEKVLQKIAGIYWDGKRCFHLFQ